MIVAAPLDILNSATRLVSTTIAEPSGNDQAVWSVATAYAAGDRVRIASTPGVPGTNYEALVAVTGGSAPNIDINNAVPKWVLIGYVNKFIPFDPYTGTKAVFSTSATMVITPGTRVDTILFSKVTYADQIDITVVDSTAATIYSNSIVIPTLVEDTNYCVYDLPPISDATITIVITGPADVSISGIFMGRYTYLGAVQRGASLSGNNYSVISRDDYGTATLVPRRNIPKISVKLFLETDLVGRVTYIRDLLNAEPAIWIGMEDEEIVEYSEPLILFGIYKTFSIQQESPLHVTIDLEIEEL